MGKSKLHRIFYSISACLLLAMLILVHYDYQVYRTTLNSAPFWIFIINRFITLGIPSIIFTLLGLFYIKHSNKRK